jgi:hypothetical protein
MLRKLAFLVVGWGLILAQAGGPCTVAAVAPVCGRPPLLERCGVFPGDSVWNTPVDQLPVHANSAAYINTIGPNTGFHPDFGAEWEGQPIGIPYCTVPGYQPRVNVSFRYASESDPGPYPIPPNAPIEGGSQRAGDRHVLVLDRDNCRLYELYKAYPQPDGSWTADSGAIYDLNSHALRPATWTSADAAGLPILPGLVRYEEILAGEIRHAIRFTAQLTQRAYVWPARHYASYSTDPARPPLGQRFRLRADFNISGYAPEVRIILTAMKKYGIILADNGSNWYISGVPDGRWNNDTLHVLNTVHGHDFVAVDCSSLMVNPNSAQAACQAGQTPVALSLGWNLLSLPLTPTDTAPAAALASIVGRYDQVYAHRSDSAPPSWQSYVPAAPSYANDLTAVDERRGLWVRATESVTLTVSGLAPAVTRIPLAVGWNLVGYPGAVTQPVTLALASIAGRYDQVYAYEARPPNAGWRSYDPAAPPATWTLTTLEPGRGYWIKANAGCDWWVTNP